MILKTKLEKERFLLALRAEIYRIYNQDLTDTDLKQKSNQGFTISEQANDDTYSVPTIYLNFNNDYRTLKSTKLQILTMFYHDIFNCYYLRDQEVDIKERADNYFGKASAAYLNKHRSHGLRFFQTFIPDFLLPNTEIRNFFKKYQIDLNGGIENLPGRNGDAHIDKTLRLG